MENHSGSLNEYVGIINQDTLLIKSITRDKVLKEICLRNIKVDQLDTVSLYNEDAEDANLGSESTADFQASNERPEAAT